MVSDLTVVSAAHRAHNQEGHSAQEIDKTDQPLGWGRSMIAGLV
jgi:hypothetical protein